MTGTNCRIESNQVSNNDLGIDIDGTGNIIIWNTASDNPPANGAQNYSIVADNSFGPLVNVSGVGSMVGTANSNHPFANFGH